MQELHAGFRGDDAIPAIVVVARDSGLTEDDLAAIDDIGARVPATSTASSTTASRRPIASEDGEAAEVFVPIDTEAEVGDIVGELPSTSMRLTAPTASDWPSSPGPAGLTADLGAAFAGIDGLLLLVALAAVLVILFLVYRSPLLPFVVLFTSISALALAVLRGLAAGEERRHPAERAGPGHPVHPGGRCGHRLRAAARSPATGRN